MRTGTSFARDWQLIKVARTLRRHDIARPLMRGLLADASPDLVERVAVIAGRLGEEDGETLLARSEEGFDPPTLMEGLLLMWGIPCEVKEVAGTTIALGDMTAVREAFVDERVAAPYLAGYARALQRDTVLEHDADGRMMIRFPARGD
jgi:hypothetical protein